MKIRRALLSVSDKAGVVEFARGLHEFGVELLSTGGTAKTLQAAGLPVKDVSAFTGFPEMLDGRVKTLHPRVHAGLLYLRGNDEHEATMREHGLEPIDLVCVNLYPFEETVAKPDVTFEDAIENIDIGGPTMLRSAAKNHAHVTVVCDASDYAPVLDAMKASDGETSEALRRQLALKVFSRVALYNAAIAAYLSGQVEVAEGAAPPFVAAFDGGVPLRYGENPHQSAVFYKQHQPGEACIADCTILHGKEMSYNNYLDGDAALEVARELAGSTGVAIIKHSNPCGYATGATLREAMEAAWAGDSVSAFGSVIAVTRPVDLETAEFLKDRFVEVLIAPDFEAEALEFLKAKSKQIRLLILRQPLQAAKPSPVLRQIQGGLLVQDRDLGLSAHWMTPTSEAFPEEKRGLADFGIKVCKHVKSNAIVIVNEYQPDQYMLLGMGAGQPNRVDALRKLAVPRAEATLAEQGRDRDSVLAESILVSDAFFPFPDNIEEAARAGIRFIIQPGGSRKDEDVVAACDDHGIAMAFTGMRHFKH